MTIFKSTEMFMRAAGQLDHVGFPTDVSDPLRQLRIDLLAEEYEELCSAAASLDEVEIADALADIIVVAYGTGLAYFGPIDFNNDVPTVWGDLKIEEIVDDYLWAEVKNNSSFVRQTLHRVIAFCLTALRSRYGLVVAEEILGEVARSNLSKIIDGRVIKNAAGKVQKPDGWTPPDIQGILERAGFLD